MSWKSSCLEVSPSPPVAMARRHRNLQIGGILQLFINNHNEDLILQRKQRINVPNSQITFVSLFAVNDRYKLPFRPYRFAPKMQFNVTMFWVWSIYQIWWCNFLFFLGYAGISWNVLKNRI